MNFEIQITLDKTPFYVKGVFKKGNACLNDKSELENEEDRLDIEDITVSGTSVFAHLKEEAKQQIYISALEILRG